MVIWLVGRLIGGLDGWLVSRKRRTGNQIGWNDDSVLRTLAVVTVGPFILATDSYIQRVHNRLTFASSDTGFGMVENF